MRADSVHSSTYSCIHNWLLTGGPAATQYQSIIKPCARQPEHMHNHPKTTSSQPSKRFTPRKPTEKSTVDTMPPKTTWGGWAGTKSARCWLLVLRLTVESPDVTQLSDISQPSHEPGHQTQKLGLVGVQKPAQAGGRHGGGPGGGECASWAMRAVVRSYSWLALLA